MAGRPAGYEMPSGHPATPLHVLRHDIHQHRAGAPPLRYMPADVMTMAVLAFCWGLFCGVLIGMLVILAVAAMVDPRPPKCADRSRPGG